MNLNKAEDYGFADVGVCVVEAFAKDTHDHVH
jgi:hypothetical protein